MRFPLRMVLVCILAIVPTSLALAEDTYQPGDLDWPKMPRTGVSPSNIYYGFELKDDFRFRNSILTQASAMPPACRGLDDPQCAEAVSGRVPWHIVRILPPCSDTTPGDDCIVGVSMTLNGETRQAPLRGSLAGVTWDADPVRGLPSGRTSSVWGNPFDANTPLHVLVYGDIGRDGARYALQNFSATITPTREKAGTYLPVDYMTGSDGIVRAAGNVPVECEWATRTVCGLRAPFPAGAVMTLQLRLPKSITGFLSGRLDNPVVGIQSFSITQNTLTVSAEPMLIGMIGVSVPVEDLSPEMALWQRSQFSWGCPPQGCQHGGATTSMSIDSVVDQLNHWRTWLKDSITIQLPTWSVARAAAGNYSNPCINDSTRLVGLVTTTATGYQAGPPTWDGSSLNYRVASMHYLPDGKTVQQGRYNLLLRSDVARCLYGFSNAPLSASVSVLSENGEQTTATVSVGEKDGWLHLAAAGFTFSAPTIKVTLQGQAAAASPASSPAASTPAMTTGSTTAKRTTITCVKGKAVKKITGLKPKCPAGWKKKA